MPVKRKNSFLTKGFFLYMVIVCTTSLSDKTIEVIEPNEDTVWLIGSNSYRVTWTQTKTTFQWDIELFNGDMTEKILDVCKSVSEYKEREMSYNWLIPDSVSNGTFVVRVKDAHNGVNFGDSQPFTIRTQEKLHNVFSIEDSFSPSSTYTSSLFTTINSTQREHLLPHEIKHRRLLDEEAQRFRDINMEDYWPKPNQLCAIRRVHRPSKEEFIKEFAQTQIPVILTGLMDDWAAMESWGFEELGKHLTQGVKVDMMNKMTPYSRWNECRKNLAASLRNPPKIYMTNFHRVYPQLMKDIKIPAELFSDEDDYLEIVDADIRPSRLSFHMESKRSGYHWRVETINGSLWSALVHGYKRWGLYPPTLYFPPGVVHNKHRVQDSQSSEPFTWWAYTQPHLHADHQPLECVQRPGEILYIPSGWWWSYINLNDSISLKLDPIDILLAK